MRRVLVGLVILLFITLRIAYQFLGGRYWLQLSDFVMKQPSTEGRAKLASEVWGKEGSEYGRVVMGVNGGGVWCDNSACGADHCMNQICCDGTNNRDDQIVSCGGGKLA